MLVLERQKGERIRIGDDIVVTVVRAGRKHVRIGVDAPLDVKIVRDELVSGEWEDGMLERGTDDL